jgi:hypothetical protein
VEKAKMLNGRRREESEVKTRHTRWKGPFVIMIVNNNINPFSISPGFWHELIFIPRPVRGRR